MTAMILACSTDLLLVKKKKKNAWNNLPGTAPVGAAAIVKAAGHVTCAGPRKHGSFQHQLNPFYPIPGARPSLHWARGGVHPKRLASPSPSEHRKRINPTRKCLNCRKNTEPTKNTEDMQTAQRETPRGARYLCCAQHNLFIFILCCEHTRYKQKTLSRNGSVVLDLKNQMHHG